MKWIPIIGWLFYENKDNEEIGLNIYEIYQASCWFCFCAFSSFFIIYLIKSK